VVTKTNERVASSWVVRTPSGTPDYLYRTEDTGLHTNPEKYRGDNHWQNPEVTINVAGVGGEQNLGVVVPADYRRRIMYLKVRHAGTANTVVSLMEAVGVILIDSWDILPQTTRLISVQLGWRFDAAEQPAVRSSNVTAGNTFITVIVVEEEA